jgi:hypothetical protein
LFDLWLFESLRLDLLTCFVLSAFGEDLDRSIIVFEMVKFDNVTLMMLFVYYLFFGVLDSYDGVNKLV